VTFAPRRYKKTLNFAVSSFLKLHFWKPRMVEHQKLSRSGIKKQTRHNCAINI